MWVSTWWRGLSVFDGESWINYSDENSGLADNFVTAIAFDQQNRVWIGHYRGGISVFDSEGLFHINEDNSGIAGSSITHITFDDNNRALIISFNSDRSSCDESVNISRTPVDQFKPISDTYVSLRNIIYSPDSIWFIAFALMSIWVGLLFQSLPGILIGLTPFVLTLLSSGAVRYPAHSGGEFYPGIIIGTAGAIGGIIGAGIGLLIDWSKSDGEKPILRSRLRLLLGIIFAIIGMVIGSFFVIIQALSH